MNLSIALQRVAPVLPQQNPSVQARCAALADGLWRDLRLYGPLGLAVAQGEGARPGGPGPLWFGLGREKEVCF